MGYNCFLICVNFLFDSPALYSVPNVFLLDGKSHEANAPINLKGTWDFFQILQTPSSQECSNPNQLCRAA